MSISIYPPPSSAAGLSAVKVQNAGYTPIPAGPGVGVTVTTGVANTYGNYAQLIASTAAATYLFGLIVEQGGVGNASGVLYGQFAIGVGAAGVEVVKSTVKSPSFADYAVGSPLIRGFVIHFDIPILVPTATRIAVKAASDVATNGFVVSLMSALQTDVVAM